MCGDRRGITLIELLIAMTVVGILLGLAIPAVSSVMAKRREWRCIASMRQFGVLIQTYGNDHRDAFPYIGAQRRVPIPVIGGDVIVGDAFQFRDGEQAVLFPDHWSSSGWNPALNCPGAPAFGSSEGPRLREGWAHSFNPFQLRRMPRYFLGETLRVDEACLTGSFVGPIRSRSYRWSDVTFPAQKALLYESTAFCLPTDGQRRYALTWGNTTFWPTSVMAVDGSVSRRALADSADRILHWVAWAGYLTRGGIRAPDW